MAIDVGQHAVASGASSATTAARATTAVSFLIGASYTAGSWTSFSDSKSNVYTQIGTERTIDGHSLRWYLCQSGTGGSGHTATVTAGAVTVYFEEITGGLTSGLLDQNNGGSDATSTYGDAIQITTTQASELLLAMISGDAAGTVTYTPGNSFTTVDNESDGNNFWTSNLSKRVVAATGTYNLSATSSSGLTDGLIVIGSFKDSGGGGGVTVKQMAALGVG